MTGDERKTKKQLISELSALRRRVADLEQSQDEGLARLLRDLSLALNGVVGLDQTLSLIVEVASQIEGLDCSGVYLVDQDSGALDLAYQKGLPLEFVENASHYDAGSAHASLVMAGEPVYRRYSELGASVNDPRYCGDRGAIALIPVQNEGRVIAALHAISYTVDEFSPNARQALERIAAQIGSVIARAKIEEALKQSQRYLQTLFDSLQDFLFVFDAAGRIVWVNLVVVQRLGYSEEEMLDKTVIMLHPPDRRDEAAATLADLVTGKVDSCFIPLMAKDGTLIQVETKVTRGHWGSREVLFGVSRDATERLQAEEATRQYAVALQARNEELDAYAQTVAHDLKNPLGTIVGYAEELELELESNIKSDENLRTGLRIIARNGLKVNSIIDELLWLAEARKTEVQAEPLDMARIVAEAQQRLAYMIQERRPEIIMPAAWPAALGYGPWVEEVWVNYLSNAIKYGGQPPRIELGVEAQSDGMVRFWVRDNGGGLTSEEQVRLFTPFERLNQTRATGHGLGLSIVRRIVEKLGGRVGIESKVGHGSVFHFTLPAAN